MPEPRYAEIAKVLAGADVPGLSAQQWGEMYSKLWKELDKASARIEHLQMQLLFYAGKDSRWPN
jgi:hypothetical protein